MLLVPTSPSLDQLHGNPRFMSPARPLLFLKLTSVLLGEQMSGSTIEGSAFALPCPFLQAVSTGWSSAGLGEALGSPEGVNTSPELGEVTARIRRKSVPSFFLSFILGVKASLRPSQFCDFLGL